MTLLAAILTCAGASFLASATGALFTDPQWADIQSFLNFLTLVCLAYLTNKGRREIPQTTAKATEERLANGVEPSPLIESIVDALETRRKMRGY